MDFAQIKDYLVDLQNRIVTGLEQADGQSFRRDTWDRPEGGGGTSCVIEEGNALERGGSIFRMCSVKGCLPRPLLPGPNWPADHLKQRVFRWCCIRVILMRLPST